jgi:hypothetical protein
MKGIAVLIGLLLAATLACTTPSLPQTGPAATATPPGDMLALTLQAYATNLQAGESVPGARMTYVGRDANNNYIVRIDGQEAVKRIGDSFLWSGIIGPGVHAAYNLRLTTDMLGTMPVAGTVRFTIFNPTPVAMPLPNDLTAYGRYANILVDYSVPLGRQLPGSSMTYTGLVEQGGVQSAQFSGVSGLPYYALGDSIVWTGQLREGVYIQLNLRVISLDAEHVRLGGTVELWIAPNTPPIQ